MNSFFNGRSLMAIAISMAVLSGCQSSTSSNDPKPDVVLGTATQNDLTVTLRSFDDAEVGYVPIRVEVRSGGRVINDAQLELLPIMTMTTMTHAAPAYATDEDGDGAVIFSMPSGEMGTWVVRVTVTRAGQPVIVDVPVTVAASNRVYSFQGTDGVRYLLTLVSPASPKVGSQSLRMALHRRETMMSFPTVTDAVMLFEPTMPSMNHGSPNNTHPSITTQGWYDGRVNFTMTGEWRLQFTVNRQGSTVGSPSYDIIVR
jgi:hypothetical protein